MIARAVAVVLAVITMMWAGPAAAATSIDDAYVTPARVTVTPAVIEPGGRSTIEFSAGFFEAGERVETDVSGVRSRDARVAGAGDTATLVSRSDGGLTAVFHAPENGYGPYTITFTASRLYVATVTVTSTSTNGTDHEPDALAPPGAAPGVADPDREDAGIGAIPAPPGVPDEWTASPDREGRVQIPDTRPDAPEWPDLDYLPGAIALLAAIAIVVTTVTATLLLAARRRG